MNLIPESSNLKDYLVETDIIDFSHPFIKELSKELFNEGQTEIEQIKTAFLFVRDEISHSWDIQGTRITCKASDVLKVKEGICYAKSNLLAAILRLQGIPVGFCYQRLMIFDTPEKGYSLHALNGVFISQLNQWIRLDARGNKPGVQAEFSTEIEKLAFTVQPEFDEKDYPFIYTTPNNKTIETLQVNSDAIEMYKHHLPDYI
ncbi:transglutaminase-like domain-containing protein [Saliterribacillus persicus]|uniref:Transglutaminase superfamily protein n=1 Tax=Saliterribacillus persicus TaxID=930114 RepID=A0A368XBE2_9BACI|nr:transglutaminase family protein [Saliterribacillus persicus]RCW64536.1 transglutaminase superfamily protein [Saliterribacillus persicus]